MFFTISHIDCTICPFFFAVAYPTRNQTLEQIGSVTVRFQAGTTAVLDPFVPPGIWHSYYYIDWVDASTGRTVSRVAGPRSIAASQLTLDERYSVDSNNFSFLIESVSRSDAGSYRGVLGLRDPEGANEVYVQTRELNITLFVYGELIVFCDFEHVINLVTSAWYINRLKFCSSGLNLSGPSTY